MFSPVMFFAATDANICPVGHYCPLGTADPEPCPKGTYNNETGLEKEADCVECPAGEYCAQIAMTETSGLCDPGSVNGCIHTCSI